MLDAFAYPVSLLMKVWHDLLILVVPADSSLVWPGSILLLVLTVRLILLRPAWTQLVASRRRQLLQPQVAELKRRHRRDSQAYLIAVQELHRSEGIGLGSQLVPMLAQIPVFLGLYHLLAGFTGISGTGGNGAFGPTEVGSFAHATVFGVPLAAAIRTPAATLLAWDSALTQAQVIAVLLPLLLVAALATFVNGWRTQRRQAQLAGPAAPSAPGTDPALAPQLQRITTMLVWLAPVALVLGGVIFPLPLAIVGYSAVNGVWTTVQTQVMLSRLDRLLPA